MDTDDEVYLLVPPEPRHLRSIRLVAADAGARAGLDSSQINDLKIAVDELCHAIMNETDDRILVRVVVHGRHILVWGSVPADHETPRVPRLHNAAELIVDAATDYYALDHKSGKLSFVVTKQAVPTGVR